MIHTDPIKKENSVQFYLQEVEFISHWPYRLALAIRGHRNVPLEEDNARRLLNIALGHSLEPKDLGTSLKREPLTQDDIARLTNSLRGALTFGKYVDVDISWFEEGLNEIARMRNEVISRRFIVYRIESVLVPEEDMDEDDDDFYGFTDFDDEDDTKIALVDQLTGKGWLVPHSIMPGGSWNIVSSIPKFSVSPVYVHAKHSSLRDEELLKMDLPECVISDLVNAIPSTTIEEDSDFFDRSWTPIAVIQNDQIVPCIQALNVWEMFYICGVPGVKLWSNYEPNFLLNELDSGLDFGEIDGANRYCHSAIIASTGLLMKLLGENSAFAFDEQSPKAAARTFRSNSLDIAMILTELLCALISTPEESEMENAYFGIFSPTIEKLTDTNFNQLPTGAGHGAESLLKFLFTHKQVQLVSMSKNGYTEYRDRFLSIPDAPAILNARTFCLKGSLDGVEHFYRGVAELISGNMDPRFSANELFNRLSDQDLVAISLINIDPVGIDKTGNFALTDFYSVAIAEHQFASGTFRAYIDNSLLTSDNCHMLFGSHALLKGLDDSEREQLNVYRSVVETVLFKDIPELGLEASPLRTRQMLHSAIGRVTDELTASGFKFQKMRQSLVEEIQSEDMDFIDELSYFSTHYCEGYYVLEDKFLPNCYSDSMSIMYKILYLETE
ncbi:hypothetical protein ACSTJQ_12700 [Vibrio parahaemolyticus]